jgi:D-alanyl-D-alanine carboxypeptidase
VVRIASISKSFASVAFMQLVEQGKIALNTSLSEGLGFEVRNPFFPDVVITMEMVMSHQSSIVDCDPTYLGFLYLTRTATTGEKVPNIKDLLHREGQYYDPCLFNNEPPGTHFEYSNFGYGLIGMAVERVTGLRFDKY